MRTAIISLIVATLALCTEVPAARADGVRDEADLHWDIGKERYRLGDFVGALEHFLASNRLSPNPNAMIMIGRSYERLRRYPDAYRYYTDSLGVGTNEVLREEVARALEGLRNKVTAISIETDPPGASIYVDRQNLGSWGVSPRTIALQPGSYRVFVELAGHRSAEAQVEAQLGATIPLTFKLERIVGHVHVESETGAAVRVDDETSQRCHTPCDVELAPGVHELAIEHDSYRPVRQQVTVTAGTTVRVHVPLVVRTGSMVVSTEEDGALVEIEGKPAGFTPVVVSVPVGRRSVSIRSPGHVPVEREVVVDAENRTSLEGIWLPGINEVEAASRSAENVEDAPASVTIISPLELRAFAFPTLAEALRGVRGIALTHDSIYSSASIRGLGQPNDYGNRLLV
ncbi:MAG: PEGA domain-containing protein, partial [Pseudomonadota bacterium]